MSCLVMRPPRPVPDTCERLMLCSRAILRTSGEERAWSSSASSCGVSGASLASTAGAEGLAGADSFFAVAVWAGAAGVDFGAALSPSAAIVPTTVFTWTVAPSATLMSCKIPAAGAGISASTLSVEISKSGSSRCTLSPGFLSHLVIVPSKIDSPIWGMTMSVGMYVLPPSRGSKRTTATPHYNEVGQTRQLEGASTALRQIVCNRPLARELPAQQIFSTDLEPPEAASRCG